MATLSLKSIASNCLGLSGSFSVVGNFFGYVYGTPRRQMSLKRQMELAKGKAFNLSIIFVGHRPDFSGQVSRNDAERVQFGLQKMREIYGQVNLGIRKLYWSHITPEDAGSYTFINSSSEGNDLTNDFYGENDGLDVFWVPGMNPSDGWGPGSKGTCDKSDKDDWTGVVCELGLSEEFTGVLVAHEVGHYLGLDHGTDINNFMGTDTNNDGIGETTANSTGITSAQGNKMRNHCYVKSSCS